LVLQWACWAWRCAAEPITKTDQTDEFSPLDRTKKYLAPKRSLACQILVEVRFNPLSSNSLFHALAVELLQDLKSQIHSDDPGAEAGAQAHNVRRMLGLAQLIADLVASSTLRPHDGLSYWFILRDEFVNWRDRRRPNSSRLQWLIANVLEQVHN